MDNVKRKFYSDDFSEEKTKKFRDEFDQFTSCFEDLSNEFLCEIFDYLSGYAIHKAFSNLNCRFEQFLHSSSILLRSDISLFNHDKVLNRFKQFMFSNSHEIFSIHINFIFGISYFFLSFLFDSSFDRLQSISFKDIQSDTLIPVLINLSCLPHLFSLTIETSKIKEEISDIYRLIFVLPKLKYYRISFSNRDHSITLPIPMNNQLSSIEYLVLDHYCTLNELVSFISYTPQLRRLTLHKSKIDDLNPMIIPLSNLRSIYLNLCEITFNTMEIFLTKLCPNLKFLTIIGSNDVTFLDAYRWEDLIRTNFPQLDKFYLVYDDCLNNEQKYPIYNGKSNEFSSSFWIERQRLFDIKISDTVIEYTIRPYRKRWYDDTKHKINKCPLEYLTYNSLLFVCIPDSMDEEIERVLTITKIYHLEIVEKNIAMPVLIQIVNLLPNLTTLKIHSLSQDETIELTVKELLILCAMKQTSQITKVYLEEINSLQEIDFIFTLCPYLEYFKIGSLKMIDDIHSFLCDIIKKINHHTRSLCLHIPIVENIEEMINGENVPPHFTLTRILGSIYLQWR